MVDKGDSYWNVPHIKIESISVPRMFLGDHGFLQMYGSTLTVEEISNRMLYAIRKSSIGLAAGDQRCLQAAHQSLQLTGYNNALLYHTDLRLRSGSHTIEFARAMNHLYRWLAKIAPIKLEDPIVGHFLSQYAGNNGYDVTFIKKMDLDLNVWRNDTRLIRLYKPRLVTVGGDILDFAIVTGRIDIVIRGLEMIRVACDEQGIPMFVTLYVASEVIRELLIPPSLYDGLMVPVNLLGHGMLPSQSELLLDLQRLGKPILAMHVLASGVLSPRKGLSYAYSEGNASLAVVGASQYAHIESLLSTGQQVLGDRE